MKPSCQTGWRIHADLLQRRISFAIPRAIANVILQRQRIKVTVDTRVETEALKLPAFLRRVPLLIVETLNLFIRFNIIVIFYM
jgi:hypothetical protein